jgi:hypothetical protein
MIAISSFQTSMLLFGSLLLASFFSDVVVEARPSMLQENQLPYWKAFLLGMEVGWESVLALMGYYEDKKVSEAVLSHTIASNEDDTTTTSTSVTVVGLGMGRTGSTSLAMALEHLGYTVVHDDEEVELTDLYHAWENDLIDEDGFHDLLGKRGYNATFKSSSKEWVVSSPTCLDECASPILTILTCNRTEPHMRSFCA